jgi:imidazole glycerol-phosphate synthase subunit HisH
MVAIIDYGVGNLTSILNMHRRLGIEAAITGEAALIQRADRLLIPGVGHFDTCMQNFCNSGLRSLVEKRALEDKVPVLGICVGAQMMTRGSEEGNEKGLGWVNADTVRFRLNGNSGLKVPHMGWTDLRPARTSDLWTGMPDEPRFYFAHSYHFSFDSPEYVTGTADYGYDFVCAFRKENVYGVQFHPEKSHKYGMKLIANFAALP